MYWTGSIYQVMHISMCFAGVYMSPFGLEMWGVLAWSWSATRGGSSAAYRPFTFSYCTNRRTASMYEDALEHSLGWARRRSRWKRSLSRAATAYSLCLGLKSSCRRSSDRNSNRPLLGLPLILYTPPYTWTPGSTRLCKTSQASPGPHLGECNALLKQEYLLSGATISRNEDLQM